MNNNAIITTKIFKTRILSSKINALILGAYVTATIGGANAQDIVNDRAMQNIEEIVVSARKRAESLQSVPLAVTAMGTDDLSRMHINTLTDIKTVPNVAIEPSQFNPSAAIFYIRGVGNKNEEPFVDAPVAVSVDGVYLATSSGTKIDMFDIEQVEILRGPQGTLQGRNSPGGAVNIRTRRPSGETGVEGEIGYGRYNAYDIKLAAETPLIEDILAVRGSFQVSESDGYKKNLFDGGKLGGREIYAGRISLLYTPSDSFDLFASIDHNANRSDQTGARAANTTVAYPRQPVPLTCSLLGQCTELDNWDVNTDFNNSYKSDSTGLTLSANWHLENAVITAVTGYRTFEETQNADVDGTPFPFIHVIDRTLDLDQFSQEIRWASNNLGGPSQGQLDWVLGGFYFESDYDLVQPISIFGETNLQFGKHELESYALFGQATYYFTDQLSISGGLRQSWDKKKYIGIQPFFTAADEVTVKDDWDDLSFEIGAEYRLTEDHLVYARFAQGYRSGGINGGASSPELVQPYDPETVDSYEIGAKTGWFDQRLVANIAVFLNDYEDLQREVVLPSDAGFATVVRNAATAEIKGLELEMIAIPTANFTARLSYGYIDSEYKSFPADLAGTGIIVDNSDLRLPFTPKHSLSVGADYRLPLTSGDEITFAVSATKKSRYTVQPLDLQVGADDGYTTTDVSIRYDLANQRLGFEVYALNIADQHYITAAENLGGSANYKLDGPRHTYGARIFFTY